MKKKRQTFGVFQQEIVFGPVFSVKTFIKLPNRRVLLSFEDPNDPSSSILDGNPVSNGWKISRVWIFWNLIDLITSQSNIKAINKHYFAQTEINENLNINREIDLMID